MEVKGISKAYNNLTVLQDVTFSVNPRELVSLIGPSGSGKTTLLKIITGIETCDKGSVVHPADWEGRKILVFQEYLLFSHMTVFDNIAFGLRAKGCSKKEIEERVSRYAEIFSITDKKRAYPNQLSGGQKQRVALARAMVLEPALLLLDEPFANLDKSLKLETARFIKEIQKELQTTTICVTHDLDEAFAMSDRIGILIDGKIHQIDRAEQVYFRPATLEAARLMGPVNIISAPLMEELGVTGSRHNGEYFIRAEALNLSKNPQGGGIIRNVEFSGIIIHYTVYYKGETLVITSTDKDLKAGERVDLIPAFKF